MAGGVISSIFFTGGKVKYDDDKPIEKQPMYMYKDNRTTNMIPKHIANHNTLFGKTEHSIAQAIMY